MRLAPAPSYRRSGVYEIYALFQKLCHLPYPQILQLLAEFQPPTHLLMKYASVMSVSDIPIIGHLPFN